MDVKLDQLQQTIRARARSLYRFGAMHFVRPYISRELPGWGRVFSNVVGGHVADQTWSGLEPVWVKGKLHGYEMLLNLDNWSNRMTYFLMRLYDLPTQLVMMRCLRPGDTFVDIGANEGALSLLAARLVGETGKVVAFEPNPEPRSRLTAAIDRNRLTNIELHPIGLGSVDAVLNLSAPKMNSGEGSFAAADYDASELHVVPCQVRRGDEVLQDVTPTLVKIDVEGYELEVLKGLTGVFARTRPPVVMEMIASHLARAGVKPGELAAFMHDRGYEPFKIGLARAGLDQRLSLERTSIDADINADVLWLQPDAPLSRTLLSEIAPPHST